MKKLERLLSMLDKDTDAIILTNKKNQYYMTDFEFDDGYVLITRQRSYLLTDFRYIEAAREESDPAFIVMTMHGSRSEMFASLLNENGVKRIAFEENSLSYEEKLSFDQLFEGFELVPSNGVMGRMRIVKDSDEIEKIITAQRIAEDALDHVLGFITPDKTEIEVALELEFYMRSHGAKATSFDTIAVSGTNSSRPHGVPRNVKLEEGFLTMDFGALYKGYCSDMTRTVVVGKCTNEMRKVYDTVLEAQLASLEAYAVGRTGREVDAVAREIINKAGYEGCFGHGLGHGVGMDIHEAPGVGMRSDTPFEVGNVVTCEPGIYLEGRFGVRIEDMVVFYEDGAKDITLAPKNLIIL